MLISNVEGRNLMGRNRRAFDTLRMNQFMLFSFPYILIVSFYLFYMKMSELTEKKTASEATLFIPFKCLQEYALSCRIRIKLLPSSEFLSKVRKLRNVLLKKDCKFFCVVYSVCVFYNFCC